MDESHLNKVTSGPLSESSTGVLAQSSYAFVIPWDLHHTGGVNQVVVNLHREMLQDGQMEPLIIVNDYSALRPVERVIDGRRTVHMRLASPWSKQGSLLSLLKWILVSPFYCYGLLSFCRRYRVRVFNFHYPTVDAFPIALLRFVGFFRGALILSFHGLGLAATRRSGRVDRLLWKFVLHCTTAIVACSRGFGDDLRAFVSNAASRVHVAQNGIDVDFFCATWLSRLMCP